MISIILPTYNSAQTIARAIESVIAQTCTDWEFLILDDGSTDDTAGVVQRFTDPRIVYIKQPQNLGLQKTLNHGLDLAKGEFVARVDADDMWHDHTKLEQQLAYMDQHPECVLIGTGVRVVDEKGIEHQTYTMPVTDRAIRLKLLGKNCFIHSSVLFRNTGVRYSESPHVLHAEDYELWLRLGMAGTLANLSAVMTTYTSARSSITMRNRVVQARRVLSLVYQHRKKYPNSLIGISTAYIRYAFFWCAQYIPIPRSVILWIQKIIRSV